MPKRPSFVNGILKNISAARGFLRLGVWKCVRWYLDPRRAP